MNKDLVVDDSLVERMFSEAAADLTRRIFPIFNICRQSIESEGGKPTAACYRCCPWRYN